MPLSGQANFQSNIVLMQKLSGILVLFISTLLSVVTVRSADEPDYAAAILTPPAPATPRINGREIFGVRPRSPFLYTIPATGDRPMEFSVENLPKGLAVDGASGRITGSVKRKGEYSVTLRVKNAKGEAQRRFHIVVGDRIALTPPMGWNSWNCWGNSVDQDKVLRSARAMVSSGLINHGWTYVNIDEGWQGKRTGKDHALQGNDKFPDMKGLCDEIHNLGLKAGIYCTPWITSYGMGPGGSSDSPDGAWTKEMAKEPFKRHGKHSFARADAEQWAAWGFDYLKYDWDPNDVPHTREMSKALRAARRGIVFSLSNTAPFNHAADWVRWANCWRTTSDIRDTWIGTGEFWQSGVSEIGFVQDRWAPFTGPGHWSDPDMLVVGYVGWGPQLHRTNLTPDEQYSHMSLWCLLSAPLLIGCNLDQLDTFTLNLLSNDEVLALDQDALGNQAVRVWTYGPVDIFLKELEDGSRAIGLFNRDSSEQTISFNKLIYIGINGKQHVRDLWRQTDLPDVDDPMKGSIKLTIPAHGVQLYRFTAAKQHSSTPATR
jgi:alpha-galactosidase